VPPVLLYPEGTTSNGEYLISFKKGAFANLTPIKLYALKYTKKNFSPALDTLGTLKSFFFIILQFYNSVTVYDLGTYYPDQLNLKSEDDWEIYAKKVKEIMLKTLEVKSSEMGFADMREYEKALGLA
jgi:lysophosphatidylcholine acyltransferase/lyso-PAF acetyltransferase